MDAAEEVVKSLADVKFIIVGDGPLRDELKERVARSPLLKEAVILTGSVPHSELQPYIASFDVGVMPDSNDYGSPMKIFEYMVMGKPVVAPRLRPIEEVIEDGENGILFAAKNKEALSGALIALLNDRRRHERIASRARLNVLEKHTWKKHAETILDKWPLKNDNCPEG